MLKKAKMEKDKETKEKFNKVAVRIYFPHEDPMLPPETEWIEADHWATLYALLDQKLVDKYCAKAEIDVYTRWDDEGDEWIFKFRKTYINLFYYPEYMFLRESDRV